MTGSLTPTRFSKQQWWMTAAVNRRPYFSPHVVDVCRVSLLFYPTPLYRWHRRTAQTEFTVQSFNKCVPELPKETVCEMLRNRVVITCCRDASCLVANLAPIPWRGGQCK